MAELFSSVVAVDAEALLARLEAIEEKVGLLLEAKRAEAPAEGERPRGPKFDAFQEEAAVKVAAHEAARAAEAGFPLAAELEYVPFPREGTVTMKEIVAAWRISQATYYRHMDIYPKPLKFEGLAKNAPARFDAAAVAYAFEHGHVERRRREVRLG